jgi:hypothetical protein
VLALRSHQQSDEGRQESLSSAAHVVYELENSEVIRKIFLRNSAMGTPIAVLMYAKGLNPL